MRDVECKFKPLTSQLRRMGVSIALNEIFKNVEYYGRGPWENYIDRKTGSLLGIYNSSIADMQEHYVKPQSMGNREDVRYIKLMDNQDNGILITTEGRVNFSALNFTDSDFIMGGTGHEWEFHPCKAVILHVDSSQLGICNASWVGV